jgi:hypothetical protein
MITLKQTYKLDDIGFIGSQKKISAAERKRIQKETGAQFAKYRAEQQKKKSKPST